MTGLWLGTICVLAWAGLATMSANFVAMMVGAGLAMVFVCTILAEAAAEIQFPMADRMRQLERVVAMQPTAPARWASTAPVDPVVTRSSRR